MQRSERGAIQRWSLCAGLALVMAVSGCGEGGFFGNRVAEVPLEQQDAATIFQRGEAELEAGNFEEAAAL